MESSWRIGLLVLVSLILAACAPRTASPGMSIQPLAEGTSPASEQADPAGRTSTTAIPTPTRAPTLTPTGTLSATPTLPSTPTPLGCWQAGGSLERGQLPTELLRQPLEFRVYLPACYQHEPDRRYPVLYLIHGQSYNDDQWDRLGADEVADALIASGEVAPFLIVMPRDRVWTQPNEDLFGQALVEQLLPWIDENYRTLADRQYRAVGGLSRGAAWAVHLGFSKWESFGAIGAHSLPIFGSDVPHLNDWIAAIPAEARPRIYLDIAEKDRWLKIAAWFENLITEAGIPHEWHLYPGYHAEAYWQAHVEEYLRWYAADW